MPRSNLVKFEEGFHDFTRVLKEYGGKDKIKDLDMQELYYEWLDSRAEGLELKLHYALTYKNKIPRPSVYSFLYRKYRKLMWRLIKKKCALEERELKALT